MDSVTLYAAEISWICPLQFAPNFRDKTSETVRATYWQCDRPPGEQAVQTAVVVRASNEYSKYSKFEYELHNPCVLEFDYEPTNSPRLRWRVGLNKI